jgi:hypothetical protein
MTIIYDLWRALSVLVRRKPLAAARALILIWPCGRRHLGAGVAPLHPYRFNLDERGLPSRMQPPKAKFFFGTDPFGRDVLSRIIYGSRVSLIVLHDHRSRATACGPPNHCLTVALRLQHEECCIQTALRH